jgi:hypothetical protein
MALSFLLPLFFFLYLPMSFCSTFSLPIPFLAHFSIELSCSQRCKQIQHFCSEVCQTKQVYQMPLVSIMKETKQYISGFVLETMQPAGTTG